MPSSPDPRSPYVVQAELLVHSLLEGADPPVSGEEGLASLRVSLACLESAETGKVLSLGVR
jgi:predicted dehydrogenase